MAGRDDELEKVTTDSDLGQLESDGLSVSNKPLRCS
jgi:hypothetical protein